MNDYTAPIDAIVAALQLVGLDEVLALPTFDGIDIDAVREVLGGFGALANEVIAPTDRIGDTVGATLDVATGVVTTAPELARAFAEYTKGGWPALSASAELGGGGFPNSVATAVREMFGSANMALSLNPVLTGSAIELLELWGDDRQQDVFLTRLIDGTWTGTMNLTEPDAGSDLGAVRTTATPADDGTWLINGTKIYITWGEHELTENIIHLVLARAPEAPAGTKGISLFLVPKVLVDGNGGLHERNGVRALALEHKMGIHASPTCVLQFDDAVGELVGPLHNGMAAMFSMMNPARVAIGLQGVSIGERSLQQASSFAAERKQGRSGNVNPAPIALHPDVQRMLLDITVTVRATRMLVYATSVAADIAAHHPDEAVRAAAQARADLLTPLAKAWATDEGVRTSSLALQVHGGMGFIEETGIAQHYRDARIAPIYEGTNGIQAMDLVGRKVSRDNGAAMTTLLDQIITTVDSASNVATLKSAADSLRHAVDAVRAVTAWVVDTMRADSPAVLAGATAYLELAAKTVGAEFLLREALAAAESGAASADRLAAQVQFFVIEHLDRAPTVASITLGATLLTTALG
ncbi:MAG: acyl-CoA dehydrogenase [Ilumatobacteraceae bacterium]